MKTNDMNPPFNSNNYTKLPRFDISEFKNLNVGPEGRELLSIMAK